MALPLIVVHGGSWFNDDYRGGMKEYIPMPSGGMCFLDLLSKLEVRLKKEKSVFAFDIVGLVELEGGVTIRMKVTDDFEWSTLKSMAKLPTIYVTCSPKPNESHSILTKEVVPVYSKSLETQNCGCGSNLRLVNSHSASQKTFKEIDEIPIFTEPVASGQVECGSVFTNKDSMVSAVHAYHLKNFAEFRTKISNASRYHVACKFELTCAFCIRSKGMGLAWIITEVVPHTCERDLRTASEPKASARAVAEYVLPNMAEDGYVVRPRDIQGQLLRDFGVRLKYPTALAGKNRALKSLYGDHDKSFQMVAQYMYMLQQMNPGSVVDLQTREDLSFQYCFFALDAAIKAFRFCRPVVVIDATHLKGSYKGVMFVASTKDGNEQIVPLAFGIGDKENDSSWIWFVEHLRTTFGNPEDLLFVSDQHRSIKNAIEFVFPGTPHGLCTYHIQGNLRNFGDGIIDIFHLAANAYKENDFEEHILNLKMSAPGAYAKLMGIGPTRWANCKCPVRRYAFGTSNAVESLNGRLRWARKLPITSLLEYARNMTQIWFFQRRSKAGDRDKEVSEYAEKRLSFGIAKGNSLSVEPISNLLFNVISMKQTYIVDLSKRECTCKVFQMDRFPCSHAAAAVRYRNETPLAYVHTQYSTETLRATYEALVMPVPDIRDWQIPQHIESRVVNTPPNPKQPGRPKTKRIPSGGHSIQKKGRACPRCGQLGHYSSRCCVYMPTPVGDLPLEQVVGSSKTRVMRPRKVKKCGICGVPGHTRQSCQDPHRFE